MLLLVDVDDYTFTNAAWWISDSNDIWKFLPKNIGHTLFCSYGSVPSYKSLEIQSQLCQLTTYIYRKINLFKDSSQVSMQQFSIIMLCNHGISMTVNMTHGWSQLSQTNNMPNVH